MKASIYRIDAFYEVEFRRPVFSRIASFVDIIEPLYDSFSKEVDIIPSDAIRVENGDSIATSSIRFTLFSGQVLFEVKLDGYKVKFYNLHKKDAERAKRYALIFERVVNEFMDDGYPKLSRILFPCWISIDTPSTTKVAEQIIRNLTWLPNSHDPFKIGASNTSSGIRFDCNNDEELWNFGILLNKSVMPGSELFIEFSGEYILGSPYESLDRKIDHLSSVSVSALDKLGLTLYS